MAKRRETPAVPAIDEVGELRREMTELKQHIRALIEVIEGVREEMSWLTRNGMPMQETPLPCSPVLKRMALNPTAENWSEQLEIVRGGESQPRVPAPVTPPTAFKSSSRKPSCPPSDPGRLF